MKEDEFDCLVDSATHAVKEQIPEHILAKLSPDARMNFLYRINDALTPILRDVISRA